MSATYTSVNVPKLLSFLDFASFPTETDPYWADWAEAIELACADGTNTE